jgi:hypothetical protein
MLHPASPTPPTADLAGLDSPGQAARAGTNAAVAIVCVVRCAWVGALGAQPNGETGRVGPRRRDNKFSPIWSCGHSDVRT